MVIVSNTHGVLSKNGAVVILYFTQYTYTPGAVGNAGAVVEQFAPVASQYTVCCPDGAAGTVGEIVVGFPVAPAVYVPSVGAGGAGKIVTVSNTHGVLSKNGAVVILYFTQKV